MRNKILTLLLAALPLSQTLSAAPTDNTARWLRDVQISPDGTAVLFCYKGDIYKIGVDGGVATRLTTLPSYEAYPLWSPDGSQIAFASDRHGNYDIFVMPSCGGSARRLTSNSMSEIPATFTPDGKHILYNAAIQKQASSMLFPHRSQTEVYKVPVGGGRPVQMLGTPAEAIVFTPDGKTMLYQDRKGGEDEWRKHHTSSITRDIWRYDLKSRRHTNLTRHAGEDRNPVLSPDGKTVYILSERDGGTFNVWSFPYADASKMTPVTTYADHPVRFLSVSRGGTLCYTYDGDIYLREPDGATRRLPVAVTRDDDETVVTLTPRRASDADVSPDGKQLAFVSRGELFVTTTKYPTTRQLTHTAAAESHPAVPPTLRL